MLLVMVLETVARERRFETAPAMRFQRSISNNIARYGCAQLALEYRTVSCWVKGIGYARVINNRRFHLQRWDSYLQIVHSVLRGRQTGSNKSLTG